MSLPHVLYKWQEAAYSHPCKEVDEKALAPVRALNPYDMYSESDKPVDPKELKSYHQGLIKIQFFPPDRKADRASESARGT